MVDMQVRVQDVTNVSEPQAVFLQLVFDHVLVGLHAAHSQRFHDLVGAVAGIDDDRQSAAENKKPKDRYPPRSAAIASQHQETRFQLDIAVVENLNFQGHSTPPLRAHLQFSFD